MQATLKPNDATKGNDAACSAKAPSFENRYKALRDLGWDDIAAYEGAMPENFARAMLGAALYSLRSYATASEALAMVQAHEHEILRAK